MRKNPDQEQAARTLAARSLSRRSFVAAALGAAAAALGGCAADEAEEASSSSIRGMTVYDRGTTPVEGGRSGEVQDSDTAASTSDTVSVLMIGDILVHQSVWESGELSDGTRSYEHLFAQIADEVAAADLAMLVQETPLGGESLGFSSYPSFNGPQEIGDAEAEVGFDVLVHATNHSMDAGFTGIESEMSFWRASHPEATVVGIADSEEAAEVGVLDVNGHLVSVLSWTYGLNGYSLPDDAPWAVRLLDEEQVAADIEAAQTLGAEAIIACPHWGTEYTSTPTDEQRTWAQLLADLGVDLIIGDHPHVIQQVETVTSASGKVVPVFWSVGNFVSGQQRKDTMVGGMARATLTFEGGECSVTSVGFTPLVTQRATGTQALTTYPLPDYTAELGEANYIRVFDGCSDFSLDWVLEYCSERLGENFSTETRTFELPL